MLSDVLEIHTGVMIRFSSRSTKMISLKNMYLTFFFPCFWTSPCFFDLSKVVWDFGQTFFLCGWDEKSTKQNIEENKRSWRIISSCGKKQDITCWFAAVCSTVVFSACPSHKKASSYLFYQWHFRLAPNRKQPPLCLFTILWVSF